MPYCSIRVQRSALMKIINSVHSHAHRNYPSQNCSILRAFPELAAKDRRFRRYRRNRRIDNSPLYTKLGHSISTGFHTKAFFTSFRPTTSSMSVPTTPYADILGNLIPFDSRYLLPENRQESHPSQWKESRLRRSPTPKSPIFKTHLVKDRTAKLVKDIRKREIPRSTPKDESPHNSSPRESEELWNKAAGVHEIIKQSHTHRLCVKPACPIKTPHSEDPFNIYAPDCLITQPPDEILNKRDRVLAFEKAFEETEHYRQARAYKCTAEYKKYEQEKRDLEAVRVPPPWRKNPTPKMREAQARVEAFEAAFEKSELCRLDRELASTAEWRQYEVDKIYLEACWANHGINRCAYFRRPHWAVD